MTISRHRTIAAALLAVFIGQAAAPVFAHNERIHQQMTDYAYHLALAMAAVSAGDTTSNPLVAELAAMLNEDPDLPSFFDAAGLAVPKLRALRSGLPDDPWPCVDPDVTALVDDDSDSLPDWQLASGTLLEQPMSGIVYPITTRYANKNQVCEIDKTYTPIGATGAGQSGVGPDAERKVPLARSHRRDARLLGRRTRSRAERLGLPLDDDGDAPDPGGLDWNRCRRLRAGDGGVRDCLRDDADPVRPLSGDRDRRRHLRRRRDQRLRRFVDGARRLHRPRPSHRHETAAAGRFDVRRQARQVDGESRTGRQSRPARGTGRRLVRFARLARAARPEQRAAELSDRRGRHAGRRPASRFGSSIRGRVGDGHRRAHRLHAGGQPRALGMERVQEAAAGRRPRGGRAGRAATRLAASRSGRRDGADARRRRHRVRSPAVRRIVRQPVGGAGHRRCGEAGGHGNVRAAGATDREAGPRVAPVHPAVAGRKWRHHGRADPRPGDAAGGADPHRRRRVAGIYNAGASIEWQFGTESTANAQYNSTALVAFQRDKALEAVAASLAFIISGMEAVQ